MNPIYFDTFFSCDEPFINQPDEFAVITAYATTGEKWSDEKNFQADNALKEFLDARFKWVKRITGYAPETGHAEPGWAVDCGWLESCEVGLRFNQDAIYYVTGDKLSVSYCDERREMVYVGGFSKQTGVQG